MSKAIILSQRAWAKIYESISREYPSSVLLIRNRMKSVLGFTSRTHQEWIRDDKHDFSQCITTIHLDFYNEPKRTMFMLKYSEYLDSSK